jgi:hypothetical protein
MRNQTIEEIDDLKSDAEAYVEEYVKTYPIQSMAIALGLGIFIAKCIL